MKDRLTLVFAANASGDLKIKPLLAYNSETPRAFKNHNVFKSRLSVMWRSNRKAWVTQPIFKEWILETFAPQVKKYLDDNGLPLMLMLGNATGQPKDLDEILEEEFDFIKIQYPPPNTTFIL